MAFFNNGDCYTPDYGVVAFYTTLKGLGARPATDVLPGIGLALGGWASRALQSERPGFVSAKQYIERMKEKSSSVKTQQLGNPVKTHEFDLPISKRKAVSVSTASRKSCTRL